MEVFIIWLPSASISYLLVSHYLPKHENKGIAVFVIAWSITAFLIKLMSPLMILQYLVPIWDISNALGIFVFFPLLLINETAQQSKYAMMRYLVFLVLFWAASILFLITFWEQPLDQAIDTMSLLFLYLMIFISFVTSHIYASIGIIEAPRQLITYLFQILNTEHDFKSEFAKAQRVINSFEKAHVNKELSKEENSKYSLLSNELQYTHSRLIKFNANNGNKKFICSSTSFVFGITWLCASVIFQLVILIDVANRSLKSVCGFHWGFQWTITFSQKMMYQIGEDLNFTHVPMILLIYYVVAVVGGLLHVGLGYYQFIKQSTKGFTLMLLSAQIVLAGYSGSLLINNIAPQIWKIAQLPSLIHLLVWFAEWGFVLIPISYAFINFAFDFNRDKRLMKLQLKKFKRKLS